MTTLRADCPRCGTAKITFDVSAHNRLPGLEYGWVSSFEAFAVCRNCDRSTVFRIELTDVNVKADVLSKDFWFKAKHLNDHFRVMGFVSLKDRVLFEPPEHVPEHLAAIYREGATCASVECFNAAATMFRLCVDLATKPLLPHPEQEDVAQPNKHQRFNLKARVEWLLERGTLPPEMAEVIDHLRENGNDGAHDGTLDSDDAADVADFANLLLQRLYTNPARLALARDRREQRRAPKAD